MNVVLGRSSGARGTLWYPFQQSRVVLMEFLGIAAAR